MTESTSPISVLVTATDFNNWDALRIHGDAQPEICDLATDMYTAAQESTPRILKPGEWHLPYIMDEDRQLLIEYISTANNIAESLVTERQILHGMRMLSAARCARISYTPFDGNASIQKEMERAESLLTFPMHASPFEHQATPLNRTVLGGFDFFGMPNEWSNLIGWHQFRKMLPNECVKG